MRRSRLALAHLPRALRRTVPRLRWLRRGERLLLLEAPLALPLVALALRRRGLAWVLQRLGARPSPAAAHDDPDGRSAGRIAWCVHVGAAYGPWPANCLQRSVVLWWFLRRRGVAGDLRIGVRREPGTGALDFHAWVEHGGVVLNDDGDLRQRYATFDQAIVPRGAAFR